MLNKRHVHAIFDPVGRGWLLVVGGGRVTDHSGQMKDKEKWSM